MVDLPWGFQPRESGGLPFTLIRADGRTPGHRCLVRASEFRHRSGRKHYGFSLTSCDGFYFAGIWRSATRDWPEAYAILTTTANDDVAPYHDRQMAVLRRDQRLAWLDFSARGEDLLTPLPAGAFAESPPREESPQAAFAI